MIAGMAMVADTASAQGETRPLITGPVIEIDEVFPPTDPGRLFSSAIVWVYEAEALRPGETRVHLSNIRVAGVGDFRVDFAEFSGRLIERLEPEDLASRTSLWSKTAYGEGISVRVRGTDAAELLSFRIDALTSDVDAVVLENIVGENELVDVAAYAGPLRGTIDAVEGAVARLNFIRDGGKAKCSGFLISPDVMLTARHCVDSDAVCETAVAAFGLQKDAIGLLHLGEQYRCTEFLGTAADFDAAALRLARQPGGRWGTVALAAAPAVHGDPLFIVQHPGGEPKQVSVAECNAVDDDDVGNGADEFAHSCDTKTGSSGAPVFATDGSVVGLHYLGHGLAPGADAVNGAVHSVAVRRWLDESDEDPEARAAPIAAEVEPDGPQDSRPAEIPADATPLELPTAGDRPGPPVLVDHDDVPVVSSPGFEGPPATPMDD